MSKFVMVKFTDGDYRVYAKRIANKRRVAGWASGLSRGVRSEVLTENTDKDALVAMAQIAREEFVKEWPNEKDMADRTEDGAFP